MKILTLLRHAKSTWDDPVGRDFDRPLNPRGRRAARTVGRQMRSEGLTYDQIAASPARRVIETLDEIAQACPFNVDVHYDQRLYLASTAALLEIVRETSDDVDHLLLVGHNPGLEGLALTLTREEKGGLRGELELKYPTGTLAEIHLPVEHWADVAEESGALRRFIRPRDLDPELGPDEDSY